MKDGGGIDGIRCATAGRCANAHIIFCIAVHIVISASGKSLQIIVGTDAEEHVRRRRGDVCAEGCLADLDARRRAEPFSDLEDRGDIPTSALL